MIVKLTLVDSGLHIPHYVKHPKRKNGCRKKSTPSSFIMNALSANLKLRLAVFFIEKFHFLDVDDCLLYYYFYIYTVVE